MLNSQFITLFFGLEGLRVVNSSQYSLTIALPRKSHNCPVCNTLTNSIHDYRIQPIKHIPVPHLPSFQFFFRKCRYRCPNCSKRFAEPNPLLARYQRMTSLLKQFIVSRFSTAKSACAIARECGISTTTALRLFDHVSFPKPHFPEVLAIDEFKGNADREKFQCLLADPQKKQVLDVLKNRKTEDLCAYFTSFPMEQRANVKYVVMDMSKQFRSVIKSCFPKAKIITDKFHTCRLANWSMEQVRKEVQKEFSKYRRKYFKKSRFLLLKRFKNLKKPEFLEHLANMLDVSEKLKASYRLKERFYDIMDSKNKAQYISRFKEWQKEVIEYDIEPFKKMLETMKEWKEENLHAILTGYSNGYVEGCNNRTKVLKRVCYGLRRFDRMRNRILYMASDK